MKTKQNTKNSLNLKATGLRIKDVVGSYYISPIEVGGVALNLYKKPSLINRLFCKWCLGWTWVDSNQ